MTIRKTARWQQCIDDRILEHLRESPGRPLGKCLSWTVFTGRKHRYRSGVGYWPTLIWWPFSLIDRTWSN